MSPSTMLSKFLQKQSNCLAPLARTCLRYHSSSSSPNEELIQVLSRYKEEEKTSTSPNSYKVRAYSRAITAIGRLPEQVRSVEQVRHLGGIGVGIAKRIDAYLSGTPYGAIGTTPPYKQKKVGNTDDSLTPHPKPKRRTLDELRREQVVASLSSINGIGSSKANTLYDAGCKSLQDLREPKFFEMLGRTQQINARYMIGLDRSMSREQAVTVCDFVRQNISSEYTVLLSGEFRRGITHAQQLILVVLDPQNFDIFPPEGSPSTDSTIKQRYKCDFIPSPFANHPGTRIRPKDFDTTTFFTEIISPLACQGLLATSVAPGLQKWDGILRVPERTESGGTRIKGVRDRDGPFFSAKIYHVPHQCAGAALIALTGDTQFNLRVRKAASQLGFRLNEYGLWRWQGMPAMPSVDEVDEQTSIGRRGYWELVTGEKEEDILEAIGIEWVAPERRNFSNLDSRSRKRKMAVPEEQRS